MIINIHIQIAASKKRFKCFKNKRLEGFSLFTTVFPMLLVNEEIDLPRRVISGKG